MKGKNQMLLGFRGSFENVTATIAADGDTILKGKITHMSNPNSVAQQDQRGLFSNMAKTGSALNPFLKSYFKKKKVTHTHFNSFMSQMADLKEMLADDKDDKKKNILMDVTNGPLHPSEFKDRNGISSVVNADSFTCDIQWTYEADNSLYEGTDVLHILALVTGTNQFFVYNTGVLRSVGDSLSTIARKQASSFTYYAFWVDPVTGNSSSQRAFAQISEDDSIEWVNA